MRPSFCGLLVLVDTCRARQGYGCIMRSRRPSEWGTALHVDRLTGQSGALYATQIRLIARYAG